MTCLTLGAWVMRDVDSGNQETVISKYGMQAACDRSFLLSTGGGATDDWRMRITTDSAEVLAVSGVNYSILGEWQYIVGVYDGALMSLYVNGMLVNTAVQTGTICNTTESVFIGANSTSNVADLFWDGKIGGAVISAAAMTPREIKAEYVRGLRRINSTIDTNDTISDNDIAGLAADPAGKYVTVMGDDKSVYIFDEFAVPVACDAYPGAAAADGGVAIKSMPNGADPHYIMAGSDQIEIVQPNTKIGV
jgi:hypothetical protein